MRRNILTYKAPEGNEGYGLICIHPEPRYKLMGNERAQVRVQVKSRYATDCDRGFPIKEKALDAFDIRLYLDGRALTWNDVDNRLKDVLDALQGRVGGPKAVRSLPPLIPNDRQIFRVVIEKCSPPKQSLGCFHVTIRRLRQTRVSPPRRTSQSSEPLTRIRSPLQGA